MNKKTVTLRCACGSETIVFSKYIYNSEIDYDISFEDSYLGNNYKGFFGRLKRAWRAFIDKPVCYTSIYCEDEAKIKEFLIDCLTLINNDEITDEKHKSLGD